MSQPEHTDHPYLQRMHDRRRPIWNLKDVALGFTLLLNFGALVWGAATLSSTVDMIRASVNSLNTTVVKLVSDMSEIRIDYNARIMVLERLIEEKEKAQ